MKQNVIFGCSKEFWESLNKLSTSVQGKTISTWNRMRENPWDSNLHAEKVKGAEDNRIWSCRVDDNYRLIWAHIQHHEKPDQIVLLFVDKHDPAYAKANRLKFRMIDGMVKAEFFDEIPTIAAQSDQDQNNRSLPSAGSIGKLFIGYRDQELLDYGVPEDLLERIRRLDHEDELDRMKNLLPEEVYNNLIALIIGEPSWARVTDAQIYRSLEKYSGGDNLHLFVNSEEFKRALEGEWEDWMIFLAPDQRRLVYADYAGPGRIRGVAGSGKTVIAIHRALHLARKYKNEGKVLFLTFGNRLPGVIGYLLQKIAGENSEELREISCQTIHQLCLRLLREHGILKQVADEGKISDAIRFGINRGLSTFPNSRMWGMDEQFFLDEIKYAIKGRGIKTLEEYKSLERSGRGTALSETERRAMWEVYLGYQEYLEQQDLMDFDDFILYALELVEEGKMRETYRAAVMDEIQDLSVITMKLIRALVPKAQNDLFLVGDGLQKLYAGGYVLSHLGIDVIGRSTMLKRNYRNTQEVLKAAYGMVKNYRFNDLDEQNSPVEEPEYSPRHGAPPIVKGFYSPEEEIDWVKQEIERLNEENGHKDNDFAILYRSSKVYQNIIKSKFGDKIVEISRDPQTYFGPKVKVSTFDSSKGLEFKVVFLVGVTDATIVPKDDLSLEGIALEEYLTRERSRLFVAMTRARDLLYITYSRGQLSRFLSNLSKDFLTFL